ncbi:uncharacterized protein LOC129610878 [Condylostylus longicornis]|uniref:uncharacterized protein LOC129610878 n=1 Tax=Condylostylus longicornis TaxID=2530218 RepID=UPI00244E5AE8|nr:uncharacterized protein LOC129610878 [Condylostylus longicornis]
MEEDYMPRINSNGTNGYRPSERNMDYDYEQRLKIRLGSWNIRTLLQPGKMMEVAQELERFKFDVVALQEMRFKNQGKIEKRNFDLYYSGKDDKQGHAGVGFWVSKKFKDKILGFTPINERICKIRLKGKFNNLTLISVYAPTEDDEEINKDVFYNKLEDVCGRVNKYDTLMIMGDLNAKIGKEDFLGNVAGRHTLHEETSPNGLRLCQLAESTNTYIMSTYFNHKKIHKGTWKIPGTSNTNQIDHILINKRRISSCEDIRVYRTPNCDSDHYITVVKYKHRISKCGRVARTRQKKWDIDKLKNEAYKERYKCVLNNFIESIESNAVEENVDEMWNNTKDAIIQATEDVIGEKQHRRNEDWFDADCERAIKEKNDARVAWMQRKTRAAQNEYNSKRKIASKICRRKKRESIRNRFIQIQNDFNEKETKRFYKKCKQERRAFQPKLTNIKNKNGIMLSEEMEILNRWEEYFKDMLNPNDDDEINIEHTNNIPEIPSEWNIGIILPIHKKGAKTDCSNYRGITLLNTAYKILAKVIAEKLTIYAEQIIPDYQCGFRPNKSTIDQIFSIRQTMEKCAEFNMDLHMLFIDFKQAFDSVKRGIIENIFDELRIPKKLTNLIMMTLHNTKAKVLVQKSCTNIFDITSGVKQGDEISTIIFNLTLHYALRDLHIEGNIFTRPYQIYAYADDIAIMSRSKRDLIEIFTRLDQQTRRIGLKINENKTKYMIVSRSNTRRVAQNITINDYNFEGIYKTILRPILSYSSETWTLSQSDINGLRVFERKMLRKIFGPKRNENDEYEIRTNQELMELIGNEDIIGYIKSQRLRWAGHLFRMNSDRAPKRIYDARPLLNRSRGRPRLRWKDDVINDLNKLQVNNLINAVTDRAEWRRIVNQAKAHVGL